MNSKSMPDCKHQIGGPVEISVCICTWNRSASLGRTLDSLTRLRVPPDLPWELIVCDNNCTDRTTAVLGEFAARLPMRSIVESRQGLSFARNACVRQARGDLIVFTDDDVRVGPDWLTRYRSAASAHPEAAFFGGPIRPLFVAPPPRWFTPEVSKLCAAMIVAWEGDDRDGPILSSPQTPWGANMGFRRTAIAGLDGPFNTRLGVVGGKCFLSEEAELFSRLLDGGRRGWFIGPAAVEHEVDPRRLTMRYIFARTWYAGRSTGRMSGPPPRRLRYLSRGLAALPAFVIARMIGDHPTWVTLLQRAGRHLGRTWEWLAAPLEKKTPQA